MAIDAPPREALDLLSHIVTSEGWLKEGAETAQELAEKWQHAFLTYLRKDLSALNELGRYCHFAFNSSSETSLQGAAFIEPTDSADYRNEKLRRATFGTYMTALRSMSARQLELLCAGILTLVNANNATVTKFSADRGVDFFGILHVEELLFSGEVFHAWPKQMKAWFIGQAKHYVDGTVSTPALRELIGSVQMLRSPLADRRAYPELLIRTCDSVFQILVTTGRLSAETWKEIERHGAIGIDCEMLASFLAARSVAMSSEGLFGSSAFEAWLKGFEAVKTIDPAGLDDDTDSMLAEPTTPP